MLVGNLNKERVFHTLKSTQVFQISVHVYAYYFYSFSDFQDLWAKNEQISLENEGKHLFFKRPSIMHYSRVPNKGGTPNKRGDGKISTHPGMQSSLKIPFLCFFFNQM